jgi:hypothetical protein
MAGQVYQRIQTFQMLLSYRNETDPSSSFRVSSPGKLHPEALSDPYVTLSRHTAPIKLRTSSRSSKKTSRPRPMSSSHGWLTLPVWPLTQRLGSIPLWGTSSLLHAVPPLRYTHPYSRPRGIPTCGFSVSIAIAGSHVPPNRLMASSGHLSCRMPLRP